jgi:hypothetical protein
MEKSGVPFWKKLLAVISFWVLTQVGGAVIFIWNALSPGQYRPGDLGYVLMQMASNLVGFVLAVWVVKKITDDKCPVLEIVNSTIFVTLSVVLVAFNLISGSVNFLRNTAMVLAAIGACVHIFNTAKEMRS